MTAKAKKILLKLHDKNNILVFFAKNGNILRARNIRRVLYKTLNDLKMPLYSIHALRHTFATRLLEKGVNIKVLSEILGHKNIQITLNIYTHVLPDTKKDAIRLLVLQL